MNDKISKSVSTTPEKNPPITLHAITWNLGNKAASTAAINELSTQLKDYPTIIALSTQEELAPDNKRLQTKLLERLNASLPPGEPRYKLVETIGEQFHTTTAGANNTVRTLMLSTLTNQNRVNTAVLIREPYDLSKARARIDYEPGKEGGNKSIITIKGELINNQDKDFSLPLVISGGHLNSNSDKKRRVHANKYLKQENMASFHIPQNFEQIYQEAKVVRVLMGDMNERDYLMKDGSIKDRTEFTHYRAYGFDIEKVPEQTLKDKHRLHGTYGFKFLFGTKFQAKNIPDPRGREHVAKGGHLDRICYSTGLEVNSSNYGATINDHFLQETQGKTFYHGSDHLYVGRRLQIDSNATKAQIVGQYIKNRLPNFETESKDLLLLKQCHNYEELLTTVDNLRYHDATLSKSAFLSQITGLDENQINPKNFNIIHSALAHQLLQKLQMIDAIEKINNNINDAIRDNDEVYLSNVFNYITKCNQLKNDALEVASISSKIIPEHEKKAFIQKSNQFIDAMYLNVLNALCDRSANLNQFENQINNLKIELAAHLQKKAQPIYKKVLTNFSHQLAKFDIKSLKNIQSRLQEKHLDGSMSQKGNEMLQQFKDNHKSRSIQSQNSDPSRKRSLKKR